MITTAFLAYLLVAGYFVMERSLRKKAGEVALRLTPVGPDDAGSTKIAAWCFLFNIFLAIIAPLIQSPEGGKGWWSLPPLGLNWLGVLLMVGGLALRYWAAYVLGAYYTRTLVIQEGQRVVTNGPYQMIRHPGYLGVSLMELGAALAVRMNWIILLVDVVLGTSARAYRIQKEEEMLMAKFGEQYKRYKTETWRLIPFVC